MATLEQVLFALSSAALVTKTLLLRRDRYYVVQYSLLWTVAEQSERRGARVSGLLAPVHSTSAFCLSQGSHEALLFAH